MEQPASDLESVGPNNLSQDGSPRKPITTVTEQPLLEEKGSTPTILHEPDVPDRTQNDEQATPGSLISNTDLKLDLSENLDHEDFSKLLELESKNDDDLFSSTDILVSNVPGENGVLTGEQPAISETASKSENEQIPSPTASVSHLEVSQGVKFMDPDQPSIDPIPEVDLKDNGRLTQDATSTTGNTREGTVTSVFEEHGDILYDKAHDPLASSALEQQGLPHDPLDNPMGDMTHDMSTGIHLPMTQFHDSNINDDEQSKISAYARLDFQSFTFYVQTLQVIIGRRSENDYSHKVDVNLGPSKSISRKHAQIFYNFGTGRFELSIMGKNGAFVDDTFVERGITVPLKNKTKVQIGQIPFQFVLPEQDGKDRKSIDPADAISLKTALVSNNKIAELSRSSTPQPMPAASVTTSQQEDAEDPGKDKPTPKKKDKKLPKPPKPPKKIYTLEEIPPEYRTKPACSYSNLITTCLRKFSSPKGMSLSEIYAGIRDLFPYYKYCPDGWQSSVRHNLSLNKSFRKVSKEGKGWLWGLDEEYIAERERQKKKQAEAAAAKAKAAQLKLEQQQQQKAKKAAAAAAAAAAVANDNGSGMRSAVNIPLVRPTAKQPNISQTLAANRADRKASADANQRTMKYLQEQLMILTKDRKGLDKQVMASILTQALAMTINQVTQAAKTKGITGNPLTALIDKNPQHLNLILAAAVNAATVKVTNGEVKQLVAMPPPTNTQSPLKKESTPMHKVGPSPTASNQSSNQFVGTGASSDGFDPSSLSKFFQPKQPARAPTPVQPRSVIPQKRTSSDTDSSSDEESTSEDESGSDGSDSDDSNTEGGGESTDNSSSSDEDTTDEE